MLHGGSVTLMKKVMPFRGYMRVEWKEIRRVKNAHAGGELCARKRETFALFQDLAIILEVLQVRLLPREPDLFGRRILCARGLCLRIFRSGTWKRCKYLSYRVTKMPFANIHAGLGHFWRVVALCTCIFFLIKCALGTWYCELNK